jgi:tripartite-type tricarboxylate transporter receptor subunit TctC
MPSSCFHSWLRIGLQCLVLVAVLLLASGGHAAGETVAFPSRPITLIVPYPGGGANDIVGRLIAKEMALALGNPVVVSNVGGASGTLGLAALAKANADGYTVGLGTVSTLAVMPASAHNVGYDPLRSFTPVGQIFSAPCLVVVSGRLPVSDLREFVEFARARPGKLNFGSVGPGSITHFAGRMFEAATGVDLVHIPYTGTARPRVDLLAGRIDAMFDQLGAFALDDLRSGRLKALAVMGRERHPLLPDVPTTSEAGVPDLELHVWSGLIAPADVPPPIIGRLSDVLEASLRTDAVREGLLHVGMQPAYRSAGDFGAFIAHELANWTAVVRRSGFSREQGPAERR